MKKLMVLMIACFTLLAGCGNDADGEQVQAAAEPVSETGAAIAEEPAVAEEAEVDVEITEKMFVAQTNDIWINTDDYLGKTIKYEGIFDVYEDPATNETYYAVIRYGPGCCGYDANAGFEVAWDTEKEYPEQNDWVEAIGELEFYEENGSPYLRLNLSSLTVLPTRGAETVLQ